MGKGGRIDDVPLDLFILRPASNIVLSTVELSRIIALLLALGDGDEGVHVSGVQAGAGQLPVPLQEPRAGRDKEMAIRGTLLCFTELKRQTDELYFDGKYICRYFFRIFKYFILM